LFVGCSLLSPVIINRHTHTYVAFDDGFVVFSLDLSLLRFSHINYWIDRCCCSALSSSFIVRSFDHPVEDDEEFEFVISIRSSSCARSFVRGPNLSSSHGNESRSSPATASIIIQVATQMIVISISFSLSPTTSHVTKYTHHLISIIITIAITIKTPTNQTRPIE